MHAIETLRHLLECGIRRSSSKGRLRTSDDLINLSRFYMQTREVSCPKCSATFTAPEKLPFLKGYPKRSFLGFLTYQCPQCLEKITYPLSGAYRVFYFLIAAFFTAYAISAISEGKFVLPGFLAVASLYGLVKDHKLRKRLK